MQINTDLSADSILANRQNQRASAAATTSQPLSVAVSQMDPSLQRLTNVPDGAQEAGSEIQDEQGARQAVDFLRQSMLGQPGTAMAMISHANQFSQNVLSLLQSTE